ncbi:sugar kinase [Nocardiopsis ansamitocini]|uniref:Carbohydrate kinase n=1 Tax=Nocardiopsis ansamitocini TaxID=1670832 RepID=A0A9W6P505_9ACTN|nr:sugar kinase [Nocardiopsis ansamitocini]GLU47325.1 carbohydrate kinase [Nocardiopsis ansamitocini]
MRPEFDVLCLGETMALLTPVDTVALDEHPELAVGIGGAESNVACGLAGLGHRTGWISRVGDDRFGRTVTRTLAEHGVDVSRVRVDAARRTGLYLKDPAPEGSAVHYHRNGSAASAMGPDLARDPVLRLTRVLHLSGITPALSPDCAALVRRLLIGREPAGPLVSFDVNHRAALWGTARAAGPLLELASAADLVFVGRDEAERLWGTPTDDAVRALLPTVPLLVVKDAHVGATCYEGRRRTFVSAPEVAVVEPVGAGDAFAAGFLSGLLDGRPIRERLRLGHIAAAAVLRSRNDLADPPDPEERARLLALTPPDWERLAVPGPGVRPTDPIATAQGH